MPSRASAVVCRSGKLALLYRIEEQAMLYNWAYNKVYHGYVRLAPTFPLCLKGPHVGAQVKREINTQT